MPRPLILENWNKKIQKWRCFVMQRVNAHVLEEEWDPHHPLASRKITKRRKLCRHRICPDVSLETWLARSKLASLFQHQTDPYGAREAKYLFGWSVRTRLYYCSASTVKWKYLHQFKHELSCTLVPRLQPAYTCSEFFWFGQISIYVNEKLEPGSGIGVRSRSGG